MQRAPILRYSKQDLEQQASEARLREANNMLAAFQKKHSKETFALLAQSILYNNEDNKQKMPITHKVDALSSFHYLADELSKLETHQFIQDINHLRVCNKTAPTPPTKKEKVASEYRAYRLKDTYERYGLTEFFENPALALK